MGDPQVIYFDPEGRLDPERHDGDVEIKLTENPRYKAPQSESEEVEYVSRLGGTSSPISADEAIKDLAAKQGPPEKHKHALITINKYGKMKLDELLEEEEQ
jgi:hypothetical protein